MAAAPDEVMEERFAMEGGDINGNFYGLYMGMGQN
jgi:hypothetical protein